MANQVKILQSQLGEVQKRLRCIFKLFLSQCTVFSSFFRSYESDLFYLHLYLGKTFSESQNHFVSLWLSIDSWVWNCILSLSYYIYSYWSNPEKIDNIEHLRQMEDSLRDSIGRLRQHKVCQIWKLSCFLKISSVNVSLWTCSGSLYCASKLFLLCRKTWEGTSSCPR